MKWLTLWYLVASAVTFIAFAIDKSRARRGDWRTPERTLYGLSAVGGFVGAFAGMLVLRHKNRKPAFWLVNAIIAIVHVAAIVLTFQ